MSLRPTNDNDCWVRGWDEDVVGPIEINGNKEEHLCRGISFELVVDGSGDADGRLQVATPGSR